MEQLIETDDTLKVPIIIVDERERGPIRDYLIEIGCKTEIKTLEVGDFILSEKVAIERKRGDDFASSLFDGRLFEQLMRLRDAFESPLIILEDFERMFSRYEDQKAALYGAMSYCAYKLGVPIIPTRDYKDTALVLKSIAKREQIVDNSPLLTRSAPKQFTFRERQEFFLEGLYLTGKKKAEILIDHFGPPGFVINALLKSNVIYSSTGKPKSIEGPFAELKGFGPKYVEANKILLKSKNEPEKRD
jgi:Fanconi anemia group M protein